MKIYGGIEVTDSNDLVYKSTVSIMVEFGGKLLHLCTGTIISPSHVVSAAHCYAGYGYKSYTIGFGPDPYKSKHYQVTSITYPEAYWSQSKGIYNDEFDVAVLEVDEPFASPLQSAFFSFESIPSENTSITQAGYGHSDVKQAIFTYPSYGKLRKLEDGVVKDFPQIYPAFFTDAKNQLFVTNKSPKRTLGGDSGGPLYTIETNGLAVMGTLHGGGNKNFSQNGSSINLTYDAYTDLSYFEDWVNCVLKTANQSVRRNGMRSQQVRCAKTDVLRALDKSFDYNKNMCEKWSGWTFVVSKSDKDLLQCWPATKAACDEFAKSMGGQAQWIGNYCELGL